MALECSKIRRSDGGAMYSLNHEHGRNLLSRSRFFLLETAHIARIYLSAKEQPKSYMQRSK